MTSSQNGAGGLTTSGELASLVDELEVDAMRKRFLNARWLEQLVWFEQKAAQARDRYYRLRLTTVIGAVILPALVTVDAGSDGLGTSVRAATWLVSLVVAASAATEQLFHFGERWRNYRQTAERLKAEGWLFLELSGRYANGASTHASEVAAFLARVEELVRSDVDAYLTEIAVERKTAG